MKQLVLEYDFPHPARAIYDILSRPGRHWQFMPLCRKSEIVSRVDEPDGSRVMTVNYDLASKKHGIAREVGARLRLDRAKFEMRISGDGESSDGFSGTSTVRIERRPKGCCHLTCTLEYKIGFFGSKVLPVNPLLRYCFSKVMEAVGGYADQLANRQEPVDPSVKRRRLKLMAGAEAGKAKAREAVLDLLPRHSAGAEIGVFAGAFAGQILKAVEPKALHLIDPWAALDSAAHLDSWYAGINQDYMDALYLMVCEEFAEPIRSGVVEMHRGFSTEVLPAFPDNGLDWIYIDGDHAYEAVVRDLEVSFAKVRPGGLIAGDDYCVAGWWGDAVVRAVDEFVARRPVDLVHTLKDQFVIRKRG